MSANKGWSIDSLVLIFSIVVVAQLMIYVIPQGKFEREPVPDHPGREMVVDGSYAHVADEERVRVAPQRVPWTVLMAVPKGLAKSQDVIFLVFLVGGVIAVLRETGAIDAALHTAVEHLGHQPWILIAGCLVMFGMGSFSIGMGEEYVPLIPILVSMCLAMKMDSIVAMGMVWIPYGIGWASAGFNPFGVVIAQNIAGLPITSGWPIRLGMMAVFLSIGFHHILRYARRVQADPAASYVSHVDYSSGFEAPEDVTFDGRRFAVLAVFVLGLAWFVYGVSKYGWYIAELNTVFMLIGIVAAAIASLSPGRVSRVFIQGASEMTGAALLIGFARAIEVVLEESQIIDTVIHGIASLLEGVGPELAAVGMLGVQTVCNLFIPSGSGQAYVTMPIMSPLATLTNVPQQTAVLAYQFGDGFTNMIVPTSALVMGTLALGRIPYGAWVRFAGPLLVKLFLVAIGFLVLSIHFGAEMGL